MTTLAVTLTPELIAEIPDGDMFVPHLSGTVMTWPGDLPPEGGGPSDDFPHDCPRREDGWACTRAAGHRGPHVACGAAGNVCAVWKDPA